MRRALRKARRLAASLDPEQYREGWAIEARMRAALQPMAWPANVTGGVLRPSVLFHEISPRYRASYLATMGEARRRGDRKHWQQAREGLAIWRGSVPLVIALDGLGLLPR